ncbi:prolyl-tRNA synthetase [Planococcus antarcticus DSM 14505]|uniref:Proline--tRNA ligase n=1 Tax=Planococcus antarcticus DSM 14505 TaxID=1185653 RepID=A0A1C7DH74_9BACL|nr:proline--tRNA ligase [Planococcus antarcticus]ANU10553.1 proline--tRNA ligase [Planococcus antarcticus DSM 14505]EIM08372.1 prolyl-tRNA synthetase [Planococcus antarcticus DSM 14505]
MKQTATFIPTLRETPADAEVKSHQLLLRAGFIRQNTSGIYSFLPLGKRVLQKVETVIREEMEAANSVEIFMPALQQAELWRESGRWYTYGDELMRLKDRNDREFALGATHEEVITSLLRDEIKSYKKLPLNLFQIQSKFRDEKRPRFGLLRGREFLMKDAYSFHATPDSLDETYDVMMQAYKNIFTRLGLNFRAVIADSGAIGGKDNHEFMVLSEIGEDTIAYSDTSSYAANIEMAAVNVAYPVSDETPETMEKVATPGKNTIADIADFFQTTAEKCLKTMVFKADDEMVVVLARGDHEVNDVKVKHATGAKVIEMATPEEVQQLLSCDIGSLGPINLPADIRLFADHAVENMVNGIAGANESGYHYKNVTPGKDFTVPAFHDLRFIQEGDASPDGQGTIHFARGIEVGHIFKLGTTYSIPLKGTFLNDQGKAMPYIMGCYGIGVSRVLAAVAEQFQDENGFTWPNAVAPYEVHLVPVNVKDDAQRKLGEELYALLKANRYEVLLDDRKERAGVKFTDADLIGLPIRITIGKKAAEGILEVKIRRTGETLEWTSEELLDQLQQFFKK